MSVISVLGSPRQEDCRFEASLSNLVRSSATLDRVLRPCFKIKNKIGLGV